MANESYEARRISWLAEFYGTGLERWIMLKVMRILWGIGYDLYNWCEDRRPAGGFHSRNIY